MSDQSPSTLPAEAIEQGHDLLPGELEGRGGAVFSEALDLLLREQDLQGRAQTLGLETQDRKTHV